MNQTLKLTALIGLHFVFWGCSDDPASSSVQDGNAIMNGTQPTGAQTATTSRAACVPATAATMMTCQAGEVCLPAANGQGFCAPPCPTGTECTATEMCSNGYCQPAPSTAASGTGAPTGTVTNSDPNTTGTDPNNPDPNTNGTDPNNPDSPTNPVDTPMGGVPAGTDTPNNPDQPDPNTPPAGNPPVGAQTCTAFSQCINQCGPNDQACQQNCVGQFPAEIVKQYTDISFCAQRNNCAPGDQNCLVQNCSCELGVCQGTQAGPCAGGNNGGCGSIIQCMQTCADQGCAMNCFNAGNAEGQGLYNTFQQCLLMNGCVNQATGQVDQNCLQAQCAMQFNACISN